MSELADKLLTIKEVTEICGISRSTIHRLMKRGLFPLPVRVSPRAVRWRKSDIDRWLATRPDVTILGPINTRKAYLGKRSRKILS